MIEELILSWQNPRNREWLPVGKLKYLNENFTFNYTLGAKKYDDFVPFGQMIDLEAKYTSTELFPLFKNRLLSKSRPEYEKYLNWIDLEKSNTPFEELARTEGIRATDSLQLFAVPHKKNGKYEVTFFSHGIKYMPNSVIDKLNDMKQKDKLYLMKDIQNQKDSLALVIRTDDPMELVGYCPTFFVKDFNKLIEKNGADQVNVSVVKTNPDSPFQFKLLCKLSTSWPKDFVPFKDGMFDDIGPNN